MTTTQFTTTKADLPAALANVARRYAQIATNITVALSGANVTIAVTWPNDATDPGDPGADPTTTVLTAAISTVTASLVAEQTRSAALFAARIDLEAQTAQLTADKAAVTKDKATADAQLAAAQAEIVDLQAKVNAAANPAAAVKP